MSIRLLRFSMILSGFVLVMVVCALTLAPVLPDAGQIGFSTDSAFYLFDVGRSLRSPLVSITASSQQWSPAGDQVLLVQQSLSEPENIVVADVVSLKQQILYPISLTDGAIEHPPVWSPDAQQVAFSLFTFQEYGQGILKLIIAQRDSKAVERYTVSALLTTNSDLMWSAGGSLRYFSVGGNQVRLNELAPGQREPTLIRIWPFKAITAYKAVPAPDGTRFVLPAITPDTLNAELYLFDLQTETVLNLSNRPLHNDTQPAWSPDGQHILFRSANDAGQFLTLMTPGSHEQTTVFHLKDGLLSEIAWSPDARRVSFVVNQSGQKQLCILDLDAATWRPAS
jgi:Tol biopolymer transport system component